MRLAIAFLLVCSCAVAALPPQAPLPPQSPSKLLPPPAPAPAPAVNRGCVCGSSCTCTPDLTCGCVPLRGLSRAPAFRPLFAEQVIIREAPPPVIYETAPAVIFAPALQKQPPPPAFTYTPPRSAPTVNRGAVAVQAPQPCPT